MILCLDCLGTRSLREITTMSGDMAEPVPCGRCGAMTSSFVYVDFVCPECRMPPTDRPDPSCRSCVARDVMVS